MQSFTDRGSLKQEAVTERNSLLQVLVLDAVIAQVGYCQTEPAQCKYLQNLTQLLSHKNSLLQVLVELDAVVARVGHDDLTIRSDAQSLRAVQRFR